MDYFHQSWANDHVLRCIQMILVATGYPPVLHNVDDTGWCQIMKYNNQLQDSNINHPGIATRAMTEKQLRASIKRRKRPFILAVGQRDKEWLPYERRYLKSPVNHAIVVVPKEDKFYDPCSIRFERNEHIRPIAKLFERFVPVWLDANHHCDTGNIGIIDNSGATIHHISLCEN